jgi:2-keto-4-pentenoate hydratase/2-oxohepta-3-ene-1,7-dioic acid hydratase in catechol pathway
MIFSVSEIVSTASRCFRLGPGDLICTGPPAGVILGNDKDARVWLKPGDTVAVAIDGIGTLTTPLI